MAPIRSSGKTKSSGLKQGILSFASAKRTASTSTAGKHKKVAATSPNSSESATKSSSTTSTSSSSERSGASTPVLLDVKAQKEEHASTTTRRLWSANRRCLSPSPEVASAVPSTIVEAEMKEERLPALNPQDRRWTKIHHAAKRRMGRATPVHTENQNKIHEILRVFDLSYEYGPCIGVSRLERWERACAMGLNPPQELKEILHTLEGTEKSEYSQCVFYDLV